MISKKTLVLVSVFVVATVTVTFLWIQFRPIDVLESGKTNSAKLQLNSVESGKSEEETENKSRAAKINFPEEKSSSYEIVQVRDTRNPTAVQDSDDLEQFQTMGDRIESALLGNVEDALEVVQHAHKCIGVSKDEAAFRSFINYYGSNPQLSLQLPGGILSTPRRFETFEEWEKAQVSRFEDCQANKDLFGYDLRFRLKIQAESGSPVARFMYAMWPPSPFTGNPEDFFTWLEYVDLAYEFSVENMKENEPLGLLALGASYRAAGYFTPTQPVAGNAFLLAAEKCGISQFVMESVSIPMTVSMVNRARAASEAIVREFCD